MSTEIISPERFSPFGEREREPIYAEDIEDPEIAAKLGFRSQLIADLEAFIRRYLYVPEGTAYLVIALWCLATHLTQRFAVTPYLNVVSPEPRCGKSRLLEIADLLCFNPLMMVQPS